MQKDIKLIAIDLDGTLLDRNHEISEQNKNAIQRAKDQGLQVVISTGRSLSTCHDLIKPLGESAYFVTINGGEIYDQHLKLVERHVIDHNDMQHLWNITKQYNPFFWSSTVQGRFNTDQPFEKKVEDYEWLKYGFEIEDDELRETILQELQDHAAFEITNSSPTNIEINPAGINKAAALRKVTKWLNLSMGQVMAIGDSLNDMAMIREAGFGVAMGNAQEYVQKEADWITATNEENGVAKAIDQILHST